MHQKQFNDWILLKEALHFGEQSLPHVSERQIWWASIGENIGFEINGKSHLFSRPVIIFKKLSSGLYLVIPLTSQARTGSWYVPFQLKNKLQVACLHQVRVVDYRRLSSRVGWLDDLDYRKVKDGFQNLYV